MTTTLEIIAITVLVTVEAILTLPHKALEKVLQE